MLSVIIPAYNEEQMIEKSVSTISHILIDVGIDFELIFIDDGSKDATWKIIERESKKSNFVRGVHFSRNFGKESAIVAGLEKCKGDCCVVIDCDLQHPPHKIVEMYRLWEKGYEIIEGVKSNRGKESVFYSSATKVFYTVISKLTNIDMMNSSDFKLLDRKVIDVLNNMREKNSFFRALSSWVGFKTAVVEFEVQEREAGESKWSTLSLVKYAINNITSFSAFPMQLITLLGVTMLLLSVILGSISLYQKFTGYSLDGFTTVILIQLFTGSIAMISLGIIGYYIAKIYDEIKGRPRYIISKMCGSEYEKID